MKITLELTQEEAELLLKAIDKANDGDYDDKDDETLQSICGEIRMTIGSKITKFKI